MKVPRLQRRVSLTTTFGALVAVPTVVMLGVYGWLFLRSMLRQPTLEHLIALLFLWQTQTGAAFAVAAALIGASVVLHQTATTRRLEETRRERRAAALRAVLPMALTELGDYAVRCAEISATLLTQPNGERIEDPGLRFPPLPAGLVDRLTELIEASEPDHARPLIVLLRRVQIQHARLRETERRASGQGGSILVRARVVGCVIDAAEIYARCEKLFAYARGTAKAPATIISSDDVKSALFPMRPGLSDTDEVKKEIDRYALVDQNGGWPEA
jgi:hypothetical protein